MDGVFIEVVIFWCGVLVTIWCTVSFQYIVVVPDVLEVSQLRLQLVERCLIVFFRSFSSSYSAVSSFSVGIFPSRDE